MMRSAAFIASLSALVAGALAGAPCLTTEQALVVANNFRDLIHYPLNTTFTYSVLTTNYTDYSDSVIELENAGCTGPFTLGTPVATSAEEFYVAQGHAGPIPYEILKVWNNCDTVFSLWRSAYIDSTPTPQQSVTGISIIEVVASTANASVPWVIETAYTEFNSGAYAYDQGVFKPVCDSAGLPANSTSTAATANSTGVVNAALSAVGNAATTSAVAIL